MFFVTAAPLIPSLLGKSNIIVNLDVGRPSPLPSVVKYTCHNVCEGSETDTAPLTASTMTATGALLAPSVTTGRLEPGKVMLRPSLDGDRRAGGRFGRLRWG